MLRSLPAHTRQRLFWRLRVILGAVLCLVLLIGYLFWERLFRTEDQVLAVPPPDKTASQDEIDAYWAEYFKYGSTGGEEQEGIPYPIWVVLPRVFPDLMSEIVTRGRELIDPADFSHGRPRPATGGYTALGMLWESGDELPIGFSKKTIGVERVAINCALCHTTSYRTSEEAEPRIVLGGPAHQFRAQDYTRFLIACGKDARFTPDILLPAIEYTFELDSLDKLLYRTVIIPRTQKALVELGETFAWMDYEELSQSDQGGDIVSRRPDWLAGRIDPFNPVKFNQLGLDWKAERERIGLTVGNSDMQPLWNLAAHRAPGREAAFHYHWDGLSTSLTESAYAGAIGDGATSETLPTEKLDGIVSWLSRLDPPAYPFKTVSPESDTFQQGRAIFKNLCADCHAHDGARVGTVISANEIGTDRHRLEMWTAEAAEAYNNFPTGMDEFFNGFVDPEGYVAVLLDGLWLRAPYLHNGSVPTLEDLLKPEGNRPKQFYRGYDVYLENGTGFVHALDSPARYWGQLHDVSVPGNSNRGHSGSQYGTELEDDEKEALIEYLKTL